MADNQKDIDFDELHQAVNALMDQTQNGKKPASDNTAAATDDKPKPQPAKVEPDSDHILVTVKRPLPLLTTHRGGRGRAMDVVGPRPAPKLAPPSQRPKRDAAPLQPTQEVRPEPATPVPATHVPVADKKEEPSDDVLASIDMKDEPAPHTMTHQKADVAEPTGFKDDEAKEPEAPQDHATTEPAPTLEPKQEEAKEPEAVAPDPTEDSATPFVTTKVEKRPLGAYTDAETPKEESATEHAEPKEAGDKPKAEAKDSEKDAPSPLPNQPQPAELSPEVVAVESAMSPEIAQDDAEAPGVDGLRNMAIPHQYKETDKAEDAHSRPVFDTKEYHPAIQAHHGTGHSKSSVGGWIMGISLVVLLLIALGFIYYMINGSLDLSLLFS